MCGPAFRDRLTVPLVAVDAEDRLLARLAGLIESRGGSGAATIKRLHPPAWRAAPSSSGGRPLIVSKECSGGS